MNGGRTDQKMTVAAGSASINGGSFGRYRCNSAGDWQATACPDLWTND
jgi:allophanate hydrolase subunit 1